MPFKMEISEVAGITRESLKVREMIYEPVDTAAMAVLAVSDHLPRTRENLDLLDQAWRHIKNGYQGANNLASGGSGVDPIEQAWYAIAIAKLLVDKMDTPILPQEQLDQRVEELIRKVAVKFLAQHSDDETDERLWSDGHGFGWKDEHIEAALATPGFRELVYTSLLGMLEDSWEDPSDQLFDDSYDSATDEHCEAIRAIAESADRS